VKRQKNDAIDAEAICEAAQRPSMRFVAVKSEQQQAAGLVFRTRDLLVRQRTQLINAIRGHLTEYGWIAPKGPSHVAMLADLIDEEEMASSLPEAAHAMFRLMLDLLAGLNNKIADLDKEIARRAREDEVSRRLMTVPGIGPISATAIAALAPPAETFAKGRDFAAWLGLTPLQRSTGGKQKLGATSKMGERTLRRLLIIGSSAVVQQASKRGAPKGSWLETDADSQAAHAGDRRARQQDGADRLGVTCKAGKLQSSGRSQGVSLAGLRSSQGVVGRRRVWRNGRRDGAGRTRCTHRA
jgi:transposase